VKTISENKAFGGVQGVYSHASAICKCDMTFGLFLPAEAKDDKVPLLWYLSGLTCTHENAMTKSGAQAWAAEQGIGLVFPDTSPRGADVPDDEDYALGQGAGFYLNATMSPWQENFQMWDYIADELPQVLFNNFMLDEGAQAITGHSMGGNGALTLAMAYPDRFASVSAFAPICNPVATDWGRLQFQAYLGENEDAWQRHDATLMMAAKGFPGPLLIDQGTNDPFLSNLKPENLAYAMVARRQVGKIRLQKGYDHSYFFIASFIEDHIAFHSEALFSR